MPTSCPRGDRRRRGGRHPKYALSSSTIPSRTRFSNRAHLHGRPARAHIPRLPKVCAPTCSRRMPSRAQTLARVLDNLSIRTTEPSPHFVTRTRHLLCRASHQHADALFRLHGVTQRPRPPSRCGAAGSCPRRSRRSSSRAPAPAGLGVSARLPVTSPARRPVQPRRFGPEISSSLRRCIGPARRLARPACTCPCRLHPRVLVQWFSKTR